MRGRILSTFALSIAAAIVPLRGASAGSPAAATVRDHATIPAQLVVIKRFGAALRGAPSSNAAIAAVLTCGATVRVLGAAGGWYHVATGGVAGWVGGARVADAANPPAYDCTDAYTFQVNEHAYTYVKTGCLSLRAYASRRAPYAHCVRNFHDYVVRNGPIEVAGEDWFAVTSAATGSGWVLARYLLPYHR